MLPAPLEESDAIGPALKARKRLLVWFVVALLGVGIASCGGGERQDADEPSGDFPVQVTKAEFPSKQSLAQNTNLVLAVQNTGHDSIPDLAITIFTTSNASTTEPTSSSGGGTTTSGTTTSTQSQTLPSAQGAFSVTSDQPGLAIPYRPVWILEEGFPKLAGQTASAGAEAAQTDTYSFGSLDPGASKEIIWNVTPVQAGTFTVHYRVAAGLGGKAKAVTADGSVPEGEFVVRISNAPPQSEVTNSGKVVPIKPNSPLGQAGTKEQKSQVAGQ